MGQKKNPNPDQAIKSRKREPGQVDEDTVRVEQTFQQK